MKLMEHETILILGNQVNQKFKKNQIVRNLTLNV